MSTYPPGLKPPESAARKQHTCRSRSTSALPTASSSSSSSEPRGLPGSPRKQATISRRNSLRIPIQPIDIPIPPSLLHSPYLNAPKFQHEAPPHLPSEEDEMWLQDTVPIGSSSSVGLGLNVSSSNKSPGPGYQDLKPQPLTPPTRPRTVAGPQGGDPNFERQLSARFSSMDIAEARGSHQQGPAGTLPHSNSSLLSTTNTDSPLRHHRRTSAGMAYAIPGFPYTTRPPLSSPSLAQAQRFDPSYSVFITGVPSPPSHYFSDTTIR